MKLKERAKRYTNNHSVELGNFIRNKKQYKTSHTLLSLIISHSSYIFFTSVFLIGVASGSFFSSRLNTQFLQKLDYLMVSKFTVASSDHGVTFISSFSSSFILAMLFLAAGLSVWGFVCTPFFLGFRGFGLGLLAGYIYVSYSWIGFWGYILTIVPGACVSSFALIVLAQHSAMVSRNLFHQKAPNYSLLFYQFGSILAMLFTASVLDTICSFCFSGLFFTEKCGV